MLGTLASVWVVALSMIGPASYASSKVTVDSHGMFVGLSGTRVVVTDNEGRISTFEPAPDAAITVDGRTGDLDSLRPGMRLKLTGRATNPRIALRIEARTK